MVAEYSIENEGIETSVDIVLCGVDPKRVTKIRRLQVPRELLRREKAAYRLPGGYRREDRRLHSRLPLLIPRTRRVSRAQV